jgi:hypothetical protein
MRQMRMNHHSFIKIRIYLSVHFNIFSIFYPIKNRYVGTLIYTARHYFAQKYCFSLFLYCKNLTVLHVNKWYLEPRLARFHGSVLATLST